MSLHEKAWQVIRRERMLSPDCAVVAGVSGGADSVALLHLLHTLQRQGAFSVLHAVHVHHGLRGAEADRDEQFVRQLCEAWQVPLEVVRCDVAAYAAERGLGVEEAGRTLRYQAFERAAAPFAAARIATAHTANDTAETLLLHLSRGSGIHGAGGIPPTRGHIIRPLITCTRAEIEAYCAEHGLHFVTDSSNADETYARNRIRHAVIPQLQAIHPQAVAAMERFTAQMRQADAFFAQLADKAIAAARTDENTYRREALLDLEEPLRSFTLYRLLAVAEERHVALLQTALEQGSGAVVLSGGVCWKVTADVLQRVQATAECPPFSYTVTVGETYPIGDTTYRFLTLSRAEYEQKLNFSKSVFPNALDYDTLNGSLVLRQRQNGDSFRPAGRGCRKTLKKLFNEGKTVLRDTVPIVCDDQGIVLVAGFGCDERVRITPDTQTVLVLVTDGLPSTDNTHERE